MKLSLLIFFASLLLFAIPISSFPLRNWDEAWYAEIIKNLASGQDNLLIPFWNGEYYFDKGPLYFWLSLPFVKLFGVGEWQVRIVSVIASDFSCVLIYLLGKRLFSKEAGLFASIIFVSLGQVYMRFSHGNLDALLITFFLSVFYFWLKSEEDKRWAVLSGIFLGLGFLIKGWALGLFPAYLIFLYSLIKEKKLFPRNAYILIVSALLSSGWWYVLGIREFGNQFSSWYLLTPAEGTLGSPIENLSFKPVEFLFRDLGIWLFLIPIFLLTLRKKLFEQFSTILPIGLTIISFLLALCFAHEKLDWHNLPIYPLIALGIGFRASQIYKKLKKPFLILFAILLIIQTFIVYGIENIYPDRSREGALLGSFTKNIVKENQTVVLDDLDFTSFLYYSDIGRVYVVADTSIDRGEFWRLKYEDLESFIEKNEDVVLITRNPENIPLLPDETFAHFNDYYFLRF